MAVLLFALLFPAGGPTAFSQAPDLAPGDWESRFQLSLRRVLEGGPPRYETDFVLADAIPLHMRRFTNYSGDLSGRYIDALSASAGLEGQPFPILENVLGRLLVLQQPDGHFGKPLSATGVADDDMAMMWGNGRLMVGLLEYYRLTRSPATLAAARRIGDFLLAAAPVFNSEPVRTSFSEGKFAVGYICWTQHIEGLVGLFRESGHQPYLELARQMAERTRREPFQHSHGFLTSLRGILELYRVTSEPVYLEQVEREWRGIIESGNRLASGAIPERLDDPHHRTEGCSEADWLRLNLELWDLTRDPRYLDEAELVLFNEFAFNQFATGDFGHHEFFPSRHSEFRPALSPLGYGAQSARAWWCCTPHGLRTFPEIFRRALRLHDSTLSVDLPTDGRVRSPGYEIRATSSLTRDGSVRIHVHRAAAPITALDVRTPGWAAGVRVQAGGRELNGNIVGGRMRFPILASEGSELTVTWLPATRRLVRETPGGTFLAFQHGPWLLAVDELASPFFFDEPYTDNRILVPASGDFRLEQASAGDLTMPSMPAASFWLPYRPGGYPQKVERALLHPLADRTWISGPGAWVFWFQTAQP
jgi:DUF1680 family protein